MMIVSSAADMYIHPQDGHEERRRQPRQCFAFVSISCDDQSTCFLVEVMPGHVCQESINIFDHSRCLLGGTQGLANTRDITPEV